MCPLGGGDCCIMEYNGVEVVIQGRMLCESISIATVVSTEEWIGFVFMCARDFSVVGQPPNLVGFCWRVRGNDRGKLVIRLTRQGNVRDWTADGRFHVRGDPCVRILPYNQQGAGATASTYV